MDRKQIHSWRSSVASSSTGSSRSYWSAHESQTAVHTPEDRVETGFYLATALASPFEQNYRARFDNDSEPGSSPSVPPSSVFDVPNLVAREVSPASSVASLNVGNARSLWGNRTSKGKGREMPLAVDTVYASRSLPVVQRTDSSQRRVAVLEQAVAFALPPLAASAFPSPFATQPLEKELDGESPVGAAEIVTAPPLTKAALAAARARRRLSAVPAALQLPTRASSIWVDEDEEESQGPQLAAPIPLDAPFTDMLPSSPSYAWPTAEEQDLETLDGVWVVQQGSHSAVTNTLPIDNSSKLFSRRRSSVATPLMLSRSEPVSPSRRSGSQKSQSSPTFKSVRFATPSQDVQDLEDAFIRHSEAELSRWAEIVGRKGSVAG